MKCLKCGKENEENAKFCEDCGAELQNDDKIKACMKSKKWMYVIAATVLLLVLSVGIYLGMKNVNTKNYHEAISKADTYLEKLEYKKAEDSYLKAIDIDSKQVDSYIKLSEVYAAQNQKDKAEDILKQADQVITVEKEKKKITAKKNELSKLNEYTWIVEPAIEADSIYYMNSKGTPYKDSNVKDSLNNRGHAFFCKYAVIKKGELYGFIDMNANIGTGMIYQYVQANEDVYYYAEKANKSSPTAAGNIVMVSNRGIQNWTGGGVVSPQNLYYYYNDELHYTGEEYESSVQYEGAEKTSAFPLKKSDTIYEKKETYEINPDIDFLNQLSEKYAIYNKDKLVTDFIYEKCGSSSNGLLAVKKDGKWGYVNEAGKIIIPIEYDASWKTYKDQLYEEEDMTEFAFNANEGYVNLVKDDKWELRDIKGNLVISRGIFDEILPVVNGKCWVKKDGKWGVIQVEKENNQQKEDIAASPIKEGVYILPSSVEADPNWTSAPSFTVQVTDVKDDKAKLLITRLGINASPIYDTEADIVIKNNTADFTWSDSWENSGKGNVIFEENALKLTMVVTKEAKINRGTLAIENGVFEYQGKQNSTL